MAQEIQNRQEMGLAMSATALDGLKSLTMKAAETKYPRDPRNLRSLLAGAGESSTVRAALCKIIDGPAPASTMDFADQLSRLALHYWRPDFKPTEAAMLNADYLEDLRGITLDELKTACATWRRNGENRFYPTSGQMLGLVKDAMAERARQRRGAEYLLELLVDDAPADDGKAFDPAAALRKLAEGLRAKGAAPLAATEIHRPAPSTPSTARSSTDAAELREHLAKKTGSAR